VVTGGLSGGRRRWGRSRPAHRWGARGLFLPPPSTLPPVGAPARDVAEVYGLPHHHGDLLADARHGAEVRQHARHATGGGGEATNRGTAVNAAAGSSRS
jgi:hypothetical protein